MNKCYERERERKMQMIGDQLILEEKNSQELRILLVSIATPLSHCDNLISMKCRSENVRFPNINSTVWLWVILDIKLNVFVLCAFSELSEFHGLSLITQQHPQLIELVAYFLIRTFLILSTLTGTCDSISRKTIL